MAIKEIVFTPNPILRKKAHKVVDFGEEFQTLVSDMIETMRDAPGVGLAAPQVAVSQRLLVVEYAEGEENEESDEIVRKVYILVNPEIVEKSKEMVLGIEGCLSVPGLVGEVSRHQCVTIKGLNRHGANQKIKAEGWLARIFQHEIDHLDGILYTDLTENVWKPGADDEVPLD